MATRVTRGDFKDEAQWWMYQRDCRAESHKSAFERMERLMQRRSTELKHDTSLVGLIIVIPPEYVHLRWKKTDFAHLLEAA